MKTVKRKAEVGERIHELRTGRTETVKAVYDKHVSVAGYSKAFDAVTLIPHKAYEVIIEDEPKGISKRLEKFRKEMRRKHGVGVGIEFLPAEGEPTIVIRDLLTFSEKALKELHKLDALLNKKVEDEPKVIKSDHGTFVVKDEESNAYISAVDADELKDEAMKRLLTPDQAREKLKLPHRVHPKPSNREHDATDYGGPLGTPIPPHSSHYHQNGLDPLEVMRRTFPPEQYEGFLRGNALKYIMRYPLKGTPVEDLEKAEEYIQMLLEYQRNPEERTKVTWRDAQGNIIEETYEEAAE